jgi:uncharacterized membrane protein YcaP (DUF421 family)
VQLPAFLLINVSPLELVARGTIIYGFLFCIFRFLLRRDIGGLGLADFLLIVLIADASQTGLVGESNTVSESLIVVSTIIGWNWLLDWGSYRFEIVDRFANPPSLVLIRRGRLVYGNLASEWISVDELTEKLREQGIERPSQVRLARLERDGEISIIAYPGKGRASPTPSSRGRPDAG